MISHRKLLEVGCPPEASIKALAIATILLANLLLNLNMHVLKQNYSSQLLVPPHCKISAFEFSIAAIWLSKASVICGVRLSKISTFPKSHPNVDTTTHTHYVISAQILLSNIVR